MTSEEKSSVQILQGTLDLMVLRTLVTMGPQHAYGIAARLEQMSEEMLNLNQGTLYPALVRLEQYGWTKAAWGKTEAGLKALEEETRRWRSMSALVEKLLTAERS